ncbi:hypothetical protein COOONC_03402 [Cooperia oncophora]
MLSDTSSANSHQVTDLCHTRHPVEDHDYIHANWVDGYREPKKFIVTQAPLSRSIDQFWKMIWQEKSLIVVSMIQTVDIPGAEVR